MNGLLFLFGSGYAFFLGACLILAGLILFLTGKARLRIVATFLAAFGALLVIISAAPLPYWLYGIALFLTLIWLVLERSPRSRGWARGAVAVVWITAIAVELPFQFTPGVAAIAGRPTLFIIGDSVAAGFGTKQEETWPKLLAQSNRIEVKDVSKVGATAASAMKQADGLTMDGGVLLLEIGGNDLLGSTTTADFERDLSALLDRVCTPGRTVLMLELPLPPFRNDYGRIQRRLASQHGVILIPKRVLMAVLTGDGMTTDGIHLSRAGHERMAQVIWSILRPIYGE